MKRYWLFTFPNYYPSGGFLDFKGDFDSREDCDKAFLERDDIFGHVFDSVSKEVIHDYYGDFPVDWDREHNPALNTIFPK